MFRPSSPYNFRPSSVPRGDSLDSASRHDESNTMQVEDVAFRTVIRDGAMHLESYHYGLSL